MTAVNRSLWQDEAGIAGIIRESAAPTTVADNEILVKVKAWAMNPADTMVQDVALPFIKYPLILGEDVAGTVEKVGSQATGKFVVGDRVLGLALGAAVFKPEQGAFQEYVILDYTLACKIPDSLSFNDAAVFPLLPFPTINPTSTGNSGVGSNAIQLCKAAGFEVITTCSAHNFEYVKRLGADKVSDYKDPAVVDQIVAELDQGECIGVSQAAGDVVPSCQVASKSKQKLRVAASNPIPEGGAPADIEAKMIFATGGAVIYHETSPASFADYLPEALAKGLYQVAPTPEIVPTKGLEGIQEAMNLLKKGISAKKLVTLAN
ncbi:chaperonin 10-like protein [Aspergillus floccosus]